MPFIDIDFRSTFGRYQYGLASVGLGAGVCLTGIYMLQCLTYLHRSVVGASLSGDEPISILCILYLFEYSITLYMI